MIIPGAPSQGLATTLARITNHDLATVAFSTFPDGERLAAIPELDTDHAVIVSSTPTSDAHIELLQLQDAAREAGASRITTIIPYMGYARQDKPMAPGRSASDTPPGYPLSARAIAKAIATGTDEVFVVSPHEQSILDYFTVPTTAVAGAAPLADGLPDDLTDPVFIAPDASASTLAREVCDAYGDGSVDHFEKTRIDGATVSVEPSTVSTENRDIIIADDIIATGGTMSAAIEQLTDTGALRVYAACVHPLLTGAAATKLAQAGVEAIIGTDTLERPQSVVSVAEPLAHVLS